MAIGRPSWRTTVSGLQDEGTLAWVLFWTCKGLSYLLSLVANGWAGPIGNALGFAFYRLLTRLHLFANRSILGVGVLAGLNLLPLLYYRMPVEWAAWIAFFWLSHVCSAWISSRGLKPAWQRVKAQKSMLQESPASEILTYCERGEVFRSQPEHLGRWIRCPHSGCGRSLLIEKPVRILKPDETVLTVCPCGRRFLSVPSKTGDWIDCPGCHRTLRVGTLYGEEGVGS